MHGQESRLSNDSRDSFSFFGDMAREFAKAFYRSAAWISCREGYIKFRGGLCEECLRHGVYRSGDTVHHKVHLTPDNIKDPAVALSWDNLELLCRDHHAERHRGARRYKVDELGRVIV